MNSSWLKLSAIIMYNNEPVLEEIVVHMVDARKGSHCIQLSRQWWVPRGQFMLMPTQGGKRLNKFSGSQSKSSPTKYMNIVRMQTLVWRIREEYKTEIRDECDQNILYTFIKLLMNMFNKNVWGMIYMLYFFSVLYFFLGRVSLLCIPDCSENCFVNQTGFKLTVIFLSLPPECCD